VIPEMSRPVLLTLGGVFGVLVIASVLVRLLRRARPDGDFKELGQRVRSWWIMVGVFSLALLFDRTVSLAFFCLVSILAFREYVSLVPTREADRRVLPWAYLAIPLQYLWIWEDWFGMFIIWIPVYVFLFLPARMVLIGETKGFLRAAGTIHWGLMTTVFSVSHVAFLLVLTTPGSPARDGPGLVLYLVLLTQCNDVAQFIWGKSFGRHKIVPRVSPNKTVEGFVGGLVTTTALAWALAPWLTPLTTVESIASGVLIGLSGFIGDVVISSLKRDIGTKDSGTLLPGHGGLLDRLDSLTYTAPLFFHFIRYLHY